MRLSAGLPWEGWGRIRVVEEVVLLRPVVQPLRQQPVLFVHLAVKQGGWVRVLEGQRRGRTARQPFSFGERIELGRSAWGEIGTSRS